MARSKLIQAERKIAKAVTEGFRQIQTAVVGVCERVEDAFVERFLTREGESAAQAKARLKGANRI